MTFPTHGRHDISLLVTVTMDQAGKVTTTARVLDPPTPGTIVRCSKCREWWPFRPQVTGVQPICIRCIKSSVTPWDEANALVALLGGGPAALEAIGELAQATP